MLQRCYNKNNPNYNDYGLRGIRVCNEWATSIEQNNNRRNNIKLIL